MIEPQNVLYSFHKDTNPQKEKYSIILFVNDDLVIGVCLTTSKDRSGVKQTNLKHGVINDENKIPISYVFLHPNNIGISPNGDPWHFPLTTVVRFDYTFKRYSLNEFKEKTSNSILKCKMYDEEFCNFIYAFYKSEDIPKDIKPIIEQKLSELMR